MANATLSNVDPTAVHAKKASSTSGHRVRWLLGWIWRVAVAATLATSYFLSILVVGWLARWTQARIVKGWWKQSPRRGTETFAEFCESLGPDGPTPRPGWILHQPWRWDWMRAEIQARTGDNEPATARRLARWLTVPLGSLTRNLSLGLAGAFGAFLLSGWGTQLLLTYAWTYGWLNSFNKGYEESFVGISLGLSALALLASSFIYLPMAQMHFAATGQFQAFFQFGLVWKLIRARLTSYALLSTFIVFLSAIAMIVDKPVLMALGNMDSFADLTATEALAFLGRYNWCCSLGLVLSLLITHAWGAAIYRTAFLKSLRLGWLKPQELPPRLRHLLETLEILPSARPTPTVSAGLLISKAWRLAYRGVVLILIFLLWMLPIPLVGSFLKYHPYDAFMNQPLLQLPAFDQIPNQLKEEAAKEKQADVR